MASGIPMLAPPPTLAACIAPSSTFEDCQAAAPAAARTHRAVPTSPPRTSSSCRTCTSMRYMLPLASSASRSHTHIAQTVPLQKVFSTACSGILCASSAPQAPPEAMSIVMSTDKTPSTGRQPASARYRIFFFFAGPRVETDSRESEWLCGSPFCSTYSLLI